MQFPPCAYDERKKKKMQPPMETALKRACVFTIGVYCSMEEVVGQV
jgi:hypothetical protein